MSAFFDVAASEALADATFEDETTPGLPALDRPLTITTFKNAAAASKQEHVKTMRELVPAILQRTAPGKAALPWLKLATFGTKRTESKSLRHNANVRAIEGVEGDHDSGATDIPEAAKRLADAGVAALLYTSPSNTAEKPRWRVLCPTSRPLPTSEREKLCARLNGVLAGCLAAESFTLSQAYYYGSVASNPAHHVELVEGAALDLLPELDAGALGKDGKPYAAQAVARVVSREGLTADPQRVADALAAIPNKGPADWDFWNRVGMATFKATDGGEIGRQAFHDWSAKNPAYSAEQAEARWKHFRKSPPTQIGAGTLFRMARESTPEAAESWGRAAGDAFDITADPKPDQDALALAFTARHRDSRYDTDAGRWFTFNGNHWVPGSRGLAFTWTRDLCRDMKQQGVKGDALGGRSTWDDIEIIVRRDPAHEVESKVWNPDKSLFGMPTLTVETTSGRVRSGIKEDMITKLAKVDAAGEFNPSNCPLWLEFLAQATASDQELIRFLQQWCGYCLTGFTTEHALVFIYGPGGNGKSVFVNTVQQILGDYALTAGMDVFSASRTDRHPQELARLAGVRLVCASETAEGRAWDETRIKTMTGGDPVTARFMRQNDFTYTPQFKLMIAGNNKPVLRNVDDAMRRRINIVPFVHKPATPDFQLESKLQAEWPGILSWMIAGCLDWHANRLVRPKVVLDATAEYFDSQDCFGEWLGERCELGRYHAATTAALMADWGGFAESSGEPNRLTGRTFADRLKARGFEHIRDTNGIRGRGFRGLRLKPDATVATYEDDL